VSSARPGRPVWLGVAAVTALLVITVSGSEAWGLLLSSHHTQDLVLRHRVSAVRIAAGPAEVALSPGPAGQVMIHQELSWVWRRPVVTESWAGDVLTVGVLCGTPAWLAKPLRCSVRLDVSVPPTVSVAAGVTSGAIEARDLTGPVDLSATSGLVSLRRLRGSVRAQATSGMISGSGLRSAEVTAVTDSGLVEMQFAAPPVRVTARAASGALDLTVPRGTRYRVTGGSGSGDRSGIDPALVDPSAPRSIDASTDSGPVSIRYG